MPELRANRTWPLQTRLGSGLWHTTHPERFASIMAEGLRSEPALPDDAHWKTSRGPDYFPFVRKLGGVSLFDFSGFSPEAYDRSHPMSSWREFVPHRKAWAGAVWIRVDRDALGDRFISANDLVQRWDEGGHHRHTIMPRIECACTGDIPVSALVAAFMTWSGGSELRELAVEYFSVPAYEAVLQDWRTTLSGEGVA